jgi:hypothetical protein
MMKEISLAKSEKLTLAVFSVLFVIMYASRVLVISQVIESSNITIFIQLVYLGFVSLLWLMELKYGHYQPTAFSLFVVLMVLHLFLFCFVLVNPAMPSNLSLAQTNGLFLLIIIFTAWFVRSRSIPLHLASMCFYVLGAVLLLQMLLHPADINLSGIGTVFDAEGRTRSVFGFGHANTLGGMCVALFMMYLYRLTTAEIHRGVFARCLDYVLLTVAVIMLLCSASRSSIIGLVLLLGSWMIGSFSLKANGGKASRRIAALFIALMLLYNVLSSIDSTNLQTAINQSNRIWLFEYAVPSLFNSGRVLIGLGYVSNTAYGEGLTPYHTLWLDNGYIYYLVATGVIGILIIMAALFVLFRSSLQYTDGREHVFVFAAMVTYLFIGLFEDMILNGNPMNYFLIPVLLSMVPRPLTAR